MPSDDILIETIRSRLMAEPDLSPDAALRPDWVPDEPFDRPPVHAAVLIALIPRAEGLSVLYTERASTLRAHSGQISFPGGRIDPTDAGPGDAALREAEEEVALRPGEAHVLGYMDQYYTGTNYLITPVVAVVRPSAAFVANPSEVSSVFEVPLALLAEERSYGTYRIHHRGAEHTTWQIEHNGLRIWGITANLTRKFRDLALTESVT